MTDSGPDGPGVTETRVVAPPDRDEPIPLVRRFPALAAIPRAHAVTALDQQLDGERQLVAGAQQAGLGAAQRARCGHE